jgi:hypothetical protein
MQIVAGVVMAANLVLALAVGLRLGRLALRSRAASDGSAWGPEAGLAVYFILTAAISSVMSSALYTGWADPELELPAALQAPIHASFLIIASTGFVGLTFFTWKTFRPGSRAAAAFAGAILLVMFGSIFGLGATEGFEIRILNGLPYWITFLTRQLILVWLAIESFRYGALLRKRMALGLAGPLVTNRFWLWGIWAVAVLATGMADPIARVWYVLATGTTSQWVPADGMHIVNTTIAVSATLGMVTAATLFLTFFPTERYRSWVESRAARSSPRA